VLPKVYIALRKPALSIQRPDLGFLLVLEEGKHSQRHDDASKKVTVPAGVAVVSIS
jgi:hypothetical protein